MTYHSGIRNRLNSRRLLFRLSSNSSGQTVLPPPSLTRDKLRKGIPESWEAQRKLFLKDLVVLEGYGGGRGDGER